MTEKQKKRLIPDIITPNRITYVRLLLIPVFVVFFFLTNLKGNYCVSAGIFALAALTDLLDGAIARKYNLVSNMGKFLDPIADKVLVSTAFILLLTLPNLFNAAFEGAYLVCVVCIAVILARELIISGFRQVAATAGIVLAAEKLGKYKTTFQDFAIVVLLVAADLLTLWEGGGRIFAIAGVVLLFIATLLTLLSAASYLLKNKAVLKQ